MTPGLTLALLCALAVAGYLMGRSASLKAAGPGGRIATLHSLPGYYGLYVALWCAAPAFAAFAIASLAKGSIAMSMVAAALPAELRDLPADQFGLVISDIRNLAAGTVASAPRPEVAAAAARYASLRSILDASIAALALSLAVAGRAFARGRVSASLRARNKVERALTVLLIAASTLAILTTIGIVISLVFEAARFFARIPPADFLFGLTWSPQTAIRADQVGASGAFGAVPLFVGTLVIAGIAMLVAVPTGLMSAVYMAEYATPRFRSIAKPVLEILAGIPTVVYGFFAALTVAPLVQDAGQALGLAVAAQSALAAGVVMGVMIIPFVSSLSDDVITAVPQAMRDGSYALGATRAETARLVLLPAALPGIAASVILAFSRALGETMIVVMAAGLAANLTVNPLAALTTVTVHIAALLVGDQEFDSPKTLSAFALGLVLFVVTLVLNIVGLRIVKAYREQYD
ncbi:MAG: phosphate ABC transporter permease subunit PstC [Alphaproteobacteria bacterium]